MKYSVLLAEDEPAAAENIYDILRLYCPQFTLVDQAENGAEALELARKNHPDLLLTDIKMPVMNGLELAKRLHEEMPEIKTVILSGYQDFEFARTALQHGAADYLLKPISPHTLEATLKRIIPLIENEKAAKRLKLIQELLAGETRLQDELDTCFGSSLYLAGLCRKNGLAGRFITSRRIFPPASSVTEDSIDIYGKDDMECIHIESSGTHQELIHWEKIQWLNQDIPGYRTIVFTDEPFPIGNLPGELEDLYTTLACSLVIGKPQTVQKGKRNHVQPGMHLPLIPENTIAYYLKEKRSTKIKEALHNQLVFWEQSWTTQIRVEEGVRFFLEQLKLAKSQISGGEDQIEFLIDDAFYYATNYEDLEKNLFYVVDKLLPAQDLNINKIDTPEFFALIEEYIRNKLAEALSLQQVCVHFGISQTYMSRLFRKYTGLSFVNYLTRCRIERAKQLLANSGTLVKDAAALAGFSDQFYFSKVFKSLTGQSPSEYVSGVSTTYT
ncbi:MAG: response regulator [Treponema sp.]|nr:response regulator [Treponema sp.]